MQTRVEKKPSTTKRMIIMIVAVLALIGIIAGIKVLMIMRMLSGMKPPPPAVVSTAKVSYQEWQPELRAVGTLRAARGADLALEVAGLVGRVNVRSGEDVKAGQLLLELVTTDAVANLHQLEAQTALSQLTYERAKRQIAVHVIAQADYDNAAADLKVKQAAVAQQQAIISKKQLRAPFAGRRHRHHHSRHLPQCRHGDRHFAAARSGVRRLLSTAEKPRASPGRPQRSPDAGCVSRQDLARHRQCRESESRHRHAQCPGRSARPESRSRPEPRHVRERQHRCRLAAAFPDAASDRGRLQPVRRDGLRGPD